MLKNIVLVLLKCSSEQSYWQRNQKQELPVAAMFVNGLGTKWAIFIEDLLRMLPTNFQFIWLRGFRGED
jgi:hypothetical protein